MSTKAIEQILQEKNLRNTAVRRQILQLFLDHDYALSHGDIDALTRHQLDRITLYRTLRSFVEQGILHEVLDDSAVVKYNLCGTECTARRHHDEHPHFKCEKCDHTYCLPEVALPPLDLPGAYRTARVDVLVTGTCEACSKN